VLLDDSLRGLPRVERFEGPIVDVGSGGGAPGIPLALALPGREVVLLEAERRKCEFLERIAPANARVVRGRAEEQETDWAGVAVAKALAHPPTAAEWCLPLVRPGSGVVLWVGPSAEADRSPASRSGSPASSRMRRRASSSSARSAPPRRASRAASESPGSGRSSDTVPWEG
jgi:16S rRNA (guanine527-N7)-methyltransferase